MMRSRVQVAIAGHHPFLFRTPAITLSSAISTNWRTAAITSAEVLVRCPRRRLGKRISL